MDQIWRRAVDEAVLKLSTWRENEIAFDTDEMTRRFGSVSLLSVEDLCGESFKFPELVERPRAHLAQERSL